jgi:pilus assembly protein CpaB
MRIVFMLVLLVGLGIAGTAVYMAHGYIAQTQAELSAARAAAGRVVETTPVFTASKPLRYGQQLTDEDVRIVQWPRQALPENVITERAELFPEDGSARFVMRAMEPGEPLLPVKLTRPGQEPGITARLTPGMRAFTIDVNVSTGVAGFLRPTDRVDIYWTGRTGSGDVTRLIESAVKVIAVDQSADQDRTQSAVIARNVTVEVTPTQVAALALAQSTGRLSLALVGVADDLPGEMVQMDRGSLLGIVEEAAPQEVAEAPQDCFVRTRRGAELTVIPIPCTN